MISFVWCLDFLCSFPSAAVLSLSLAIPTSFLNINSSLHDLWCKDWHLVDDRTELTILAAKPIFYQILQSRDLWRGFQVHIQSMESVSLKNILNVFFSWCKDFARHQARKQLFGHIKKLSNTDFGWSCVFASSLLNMQKQDSEHSQKTEWSCYLFSSHGKHIFLIYAIY